ncbi:hypothetical protein ACTHOS_01970 [Bacillus safensis]|mgnify:CR=1 FL=1|uniref:Uncharacterized protein n=3 Tax=Bacillus TaxID=1386 RepID=A0AC61YUP4_BACIA|nr:hypothetical protein BA81_01805 [Bacillus safensis FO-36b]MBI1629778.1 hypothetical protein [Bacillus safensis]MBW4849221.1 hypothetical protein [Bacillaceae bacterium]MBY0190380.1 hypothetical protein [Bacillus aerophilus]MDH6561650.1 hypothetical protein [Bacillus sp. TBS-096]QNH49833.1 hypothetical protein H7F25_10870 [Bacillus sp. PAMC28571]QNK46433.1 hypothetical protein H7F24_17435 [Bacillus sp. PAMC22265]QRY39414.1 hypothetical protein JVX94_01940 [Bacillus sp. PDNC022]QSJ02949.1 
MSMSPYMRFPSVGHGYASIPHSLKHGYGNPYRMQREQEEMLRRYMYQYRTYWY